MTHLICASLAGRGELFLGQALTRVDSDTGKMKLGRHSPWYVPSRFSSRSSFGDTSAFLGSAGHVGAALVLLPHISWIRSSISLKISHQSSHHEPWDPISPPAILSMAPPVLHPTLCSTITNGLRYFQMFGVLLDDHVVCEPHHPPSRTEHRKVSCHFLMGVHSVIIPRLFRQMLTNATQ